MGPSLLWWISVTRRPCVGTPTCKPLGSDTSKLHQSPYPQRAYSILAFGISDLDTRVSSVLWQRWMLRNAA